MGVSRNTLIRYMEGQKIFVEGLDRTITFTDREVEASRILARVPATPGHVTVLYGPRGCGKSILFRIFMRAVKSSEKGSGFVLVGLEEGSLLAREVLASGSLLTVIRDAGRSFGFDLDGYGRLTRSMGVYELVNIISGYIAKKSDVAEKDIVIIVDGVRIKTLRDVSLVCNVVKSLGRTIERDHEMYRERGGRSISLILVASGALVREVRERISRTQDLNLFWSIIWNLPREASDRLADQLGISEDKDLLWRLAGGNPGELVRIKLLGLSRWIRLAVMKSLWKAMLYLTKRYSYRGDAAMSKIEEAIENLDSVWNSWAVLHLIKRDILMPMHIADTRLSRVPDEPWIGRRYSFQIPAHYYALKILSERREIAVDADDIIKRAREG